MIALAAMMLLTSAAKAQTITAETVLNIYLEAVQSNSKEFAYNADGPVWAADGKSLTSATESSQPSTSTPNSSKA